MTNETTASHPAESAALWGKIRKAAAAADDAKVTALLTEAELPLRLSKLLVTAISEEAQLAQIEVTAQGMSEKLQEVGQQLAMYADVHPATPEEARKLAQDRADLNKQDTAARQALDAATRAGRQRKWLTVWLPELFGQMPPKHCGYLSGLQPAPKTAAVATALGIRDHYGVSPWRQLDQQPDEPTKPRKRYQSFSPVAPRR